MSDAAPEANATVEPHPASEESARGGGLTIALLVLWRIDPMAFGKDPMPSGSDVEEGRVEFDLPTLYVRLRAGV